MCRFWHSVFTGSRHHKSVLDWARGASPGRKESGNVVRVVFVRKYFVEKKMIFRNFEKSNFFFDVPKKIFGSKIFWCWIFFWNDIIHTNPVMQRLGEFRHPQSCFLTLAGELWLSLYLSIYSRDEPNLKGLSADRNPGLRPGIIIIHLLLLLGNTRELKCYIIL